MSLFLFVTLLVITSASLPASSGNTPYVVLPRNITALSGSCVQTPCTFNVSDFEDKLRTTKGIFGYWLKRTYQFSDFVFNSSGPIIKGFSLIEMVGNLSRRECSTVFYNVKNNHSDVYFFRIQMEPNILRFTFANPVNINVLDVAKPPKLNDLPEVMEGTAVNLICSAEVPCPKQPPTLSWTNIPKSANITTQLQEKPDKTHSVFSSMTFNASYMDHKMNISCTATYPRNIFNNTTVNSTVMLQVLCKRI
ncbi:myelin-associated glycoprotein [Misgurnus anguillicaudatus]|uniref:myelin-associated glycoprotein n=1 Tax=Misgurnus anguillicaudatus TaxID=75329 RepID=UPI003CCF3C19